MSYDPLDLSAFQDLGLTLRAAHRKALILDLERVGAQLLCWAEIMEKIGNPDPILERLYAAHLEDEAAKAKVTVSVPASWVRDGFVGDTPALHAPSPEAKPATDVASASGSDEKGEVL